MTEPKTQVNFLEDFTRKEIEAPQENSKKKFLPLWLKLFLVVFLVLTTFFSGIIFSGGKTLENSSGGLPKIGVSQVWTAFKGYVLGHEGKLEGKKEDRINVLMLGMGGIGHEGPFLTDTNIIASIKPSTGEIAMISVPRDMYVPIPGYGWQKINHANSFGETYQDGQGGELASQTIEQIFDMPIHYYVRVDFSGFEKIIDDLGGIEVDVQRSFIDKEYPAPEFKYQVVSFDKGVQEMDGDTALKFVRSRHGNNGEGSDFARTKRQQQVIIAIKDKAVSASTLLNPAKINKVLKSLDNSISTNLTADEIIYLSKFGQDFSLDDIITFNFNSAPDNFLVSDFTSGGAYILRPKSGNFNDMTNLVKNIFNQDDLEQYQTPQYYSPTNNDTTTQETEESEDGANSDEESTEEITDEDLVNPKNETESETEESSNETNLADYTITVLNGTKITGLAGKTASELEELGFTIEEITNAPTQDYQKTLLYQINSQESLSETVKLISQHYSITLGETLPESLASYSLQNVDFILVLGPDNS